MERKNAHIAELSYDANGPQPIMELAVPHGTPVRSILKSMELITELNRKLSPRGCEACLSGTHLIIRERFEEVIRVDLEKGAFIDM